MGFSSFGIRNLADGWLNYFKPGLPCALRLQVYDPSSTAFAELGFVPAVTGAQSGVIDVPIIPQPDVAEVSLHNIGLNAATLRFGARSFLISHTFVLAQMAAMGFTDPTQVFTDDSVIGLYYDSRLFEIVSYTHQDAGGQPITWTLVCNAGQVTSPAGQPGN